MTRAGQGNGAGAWSHGPGVRHGCSARGPACGRPEGPGQQGDRKDAGARASRLHLTPTSAGDSATTSPRLCLLFTPRRVITAPLHRGGTELGRNPRSRRDCRVPGSPAPRPEPQHPREPAALPPGGGESERLLGAPVPRPPQVGETVRGPGRPPPSAAISSIPTGSLRACWGGHRAAQPPSRVRGTGGPSLPAPGVPLQRQAAWRRGGAGAGPGCQQPGPPHPGPVQLERLSLALQIHARPGAATPKRRRCRARPGQQTLAPRPDSALPPL